MDEEQWRPVEGYPNYEVSSLGRVRTWRGHTTRGGAPLILRLQRNSKNGYVQVALSHEGKRRQFNLHALIARVFLGPPPAGMETAHNDGDQMNNRLSNLRYTTHLSNIRDKAQHGTQLQGETIQWAKLSEDDIPQILERLAAGVLIKKVAEEFQVSRSLITAIRQGKVWQHLNLAAAYGPMRREESYPQMVLSTEDVANIRARVAAGEMQKTVADAYGISRSYTSALVNHKARTEE